MRRPGYSPFQSEQLFSKLARLWNSKAVQDLVQRLGKFAQLRMSSFYKVTDRRALQECLMCRETSTGAGRESRPFSPNGSGCTCWLLAMRE